MTRVSWFAVGVAVACALVVTRDARAAKVTDVADAVDGEDPFDANLEVKLDFSWHQGVLTRENFQPPANDPNGAGRLVEGTEMSFQHMKLRAKPRLEVGIFRDLSVFAEWPIILWDQKDFQYAAGTNNDNSTFARDQAPNTSPGVDSWADETGKPITAGAGNDLPENQDGAFGFPGKEYNDWRFDHQNDGSFIGYRQGFDNPTFGVRFSPVNNERDDTTPTITLQADYTAPFFQFMNPTDEALNDPQTPGAVADGAHRFHFSIALSKRFLILDPYFVVEYGLPLAAPSGGSVLGYFPRHQGGATAGVEIVPYENDKMKQRFALDFSANATYYSEGRDYSVASDVLKEQTYADQSVRAGLNAGMNFRAFELFFIDLSGFVAYDTEHLLTIEDFGVDGPDAAEQVNLDNPAERNAFYNPALDTVGRRVGLEQSVHIGALLHFGATF